MNLDYLNNKVAVVTGAAQGIGRAISEKLAELGMFVVLADINKEILLKTTEELSSNGLNVTSVVTDVADPNSVQALADKTINEFESIHVLCNNAGIIGPIKGSLWEYSIAEWRKVVDTNFLSVVNGINTFLPLMIKHKDPAIIVNTASELGLMTMSDVPIYTSTKHAIVNLTEALYFQLAQNNCNVKAILLCPGVTRTGIFDSVKDDYSKEEFNDMLSNADNPDFVADELIKSIESDQFYCVTTPLVNTAIEQRLKDILSRKNPTIYPIGVYCGVCGRNRDKDCQTCFKN